MPNPPAISQSIFIQRKRRKSVHFAACPGWRMNCTPRWSSALISGYSCLISAGFSFYPQIFQPGKWRLCTHTWNTGQKRQRLKCRGCRMLALSFCSVRFVLWVFFFFCRCSCCFPGLILSVNIPAWLHSLGVSRPNFSLLAPGNHKLIVSDSQWVWDWLQTKILDKIINLTHPCDVIVSGFRNVSKLFPIFSHFIWFPSSPAGSKVLLWWTLIHASLGLEEPLVSVIIVL